jgi:HPt (histidine-containing phosphotransfer) domain-containing protein
VRSVDFPSVARAPSAGQPTPIINRETLGHLRELSPNAAFVENLVGVFLTDSDVLLGRVEQALAARNYKEFRSLLHAMKGSSASIGTERLTALCGSLGSLSDAEMRLQGPSLLRSLGDELGTTRAELERYVRESKQSTA